MAKRRHHYVPQFYLRNFVNPHANGKIWVYAKRGDRLVAASPRDVAVEKDYHTVTRNDGVKDRHSIEDTFADLENRAAPIVQKILSRQPLSDEDREIFVVFVAQLLLRVPARRDETGRMMASMLEHMAKTFASERESFHADYRRFQKETGNNSTVDVEEIRQFILSEDCELKVNSAAALGTSISALAAVTDCLLRMHWVFLRRRGRFQFLTCDNPVFYCDPTVPPNTWRGVGLANRGVEVSLPLSADVVAFASYRQGPRVWNDIAPELVRRFKQQTVDSAYRYVFAAEYSDGLQRFICRNNDRSLPVQPYTR